MNKIKILMVDDHESILFGYDAILNQNTLNIEVESVLCNSIEKAYSVLSKPENSHYFDFIFIDRSMPEYKEKGLMNGEDLAKYILKINKDAKIVILTSHVEPIVLSNMINLIRPIGVLVKIDFDFEELNKAFEMFINNKVYYSQTVVNALDVFKKLNFYFDEIDKKIIYLIAQGVQTKKLPEYIPLALDTINKRKSRIKTCLDVEHGSDEDIIRISRGLGIIL